MTTSTPQLVPNSKRNRSVCRSTHLYAAGLCLFSALATIDSAWAADRDDDDIPDLVEESVGLDDRDPEDALLDLDGDGWSNLDEYRFGTLIDDPTSRPDLLETLPHQKVAASDGGADNRFASSVAISGDIALISGVGRRGGSATSTTGASGGSSSAGTVAVSTSSAGSVSGGASVSFVTEPGVVYAFVRQNGIWVEEAQLSADDAESFDAFGSSISLSGNTALIGAQGDDDQGNGAGSAYVFVRDNGVWTQQAKLTADDGAAGDRFGHTAALSGDVALIGAELDDHNAQNDGSAYIFRRTDGQWQQEAKLVSDDGAENDFFGTQVAIDGETALITAEGDDDSGSFSGSAYVFVKNKNNGTWQQQAKLVATDGAEGDFFGRSAAISGNTALIGAPTDDDNGNASGSAYAFRRTGTVWKLQAKLTANDGSTGDAFGSSISLDGDIAVIGASNDDDKGHLAGSSYVFEKTLSGWLQREKLTAADAGDLRFFGSRVALSGNQVLVGAPFDDDDGEQSGSAYFFQVGLDLHVGAVEDVNHTSSFFGFDNAFRGLPIVLSDMQTIRGSDTAAVRIEMVAKDGFTAKIEEEQSLDSEVTHAREKIGILALQPDAIIRDAAGNVVGETGVNILATNNSGSDYTRRLRNSYVDPVVVMQINSANGQQPAHIRLAGTTDSSFNFEIEEWDYLDGVHLAERIGFIVVESGSHVLPSGHVLQAINVDADHNVKTVQFPEPFESQPVVFSQSQTRNGGDPIVTRNSNVTSNGVNVRLQEEEAKNGTHTIERVGIIAITQ